MHLRGEKAGPRVTDFDIIIKSSSIKSGDVCLFGSKEEEVLTCVCRQCVLGRFWVGLWKGTQPNLETPDS